MKTTEKLSRSKELQSKLALYSATAGAALLAAPATQAAVVDITTFSFDFGLTFGTTPPDVTGSPPNIFHGVYFTGGTAGHKGVFRGFFSGVRFTGSSSNTAAFYMGSKIAHTGGGSFGAAEKLALNAPIAGRNFYGYTYHTLAAKSTYSGSQAGQFLPNGANAAVTGYVGFKTYLSSHTYYGWLRVKVINDGMGLPFEVTLVDKNGDGIFGAFGRPEDNIVAGQTAAVPDQSPTVGLFGLALLALGAEGVREMRRRRTEAAPIAK